MLKLAISTLRLCEYALSHPDACGTDIDTALDETRQTIAKLEKAQDEAVYLLQHAVCGFIGESVHNTTLGWQWWERRQAFLKEYGRL